MDQEKQAPEKIEHPTQDFMATFMDSIRKGIETFSQLPVDLAGKIEESVDEIGARFERKVTGNRMGLFRWTGIPDPDQLAVITEKLDVLEKRLKSIESNVKALDKQAKPSPSAKNGAAKRPAKKGTKTK